MDITITTTAEQDAALQWTANQAANAALAPGDTPATANPEEYLRARIATILNDYLQQYKVATAPITVDQGVQAFLNATPDQQAEALRILGVQ